MAIGQAVLPGTLDVGALTALELRMEQREVRRSAEHGGALREVLALRALFGSSGRDLATVSHIALVYRCSEWRAADLLSSAQLLIALPGAVEALECGLLTVEQSKTVVAVLGPLPDEVALVVWARLQARLIADADGGVVCPPARLREVLGRWVIQADGDVAVRRREDAAQAAGVDYRRRTDGLVDVFASGMSGLDAQACLSRIRACAEPVGAGDDRPAGRRRLDALIDLILGRQRLTADGDPVPTGSDYPASGAASGCGAPGCGCRPGQPVPCGVDVSVLVPLGAALSTTDEVAELVGHGPIEPDLLGQVLLAAPRLRPVWVDDAGVPVAVGAGRAVRVERDDAAAVREALLGLAARTPGPVQPRHPDDHLPTPPAQAAGGGETLGPALDGPPAPASRENGGLFAGYGRTAPKVSPPPPAPVLSWPRLPGGADLPDLPGPPDLSVLPRLLTRSHPAGIPGPYRLPTWLRRLIGVRRPLCEWPGCGIRASGCDAEHDRAWPHGPTCSCNLGPACRRHHRVKQLGWTKQRLRDAAVRWTSPTGRAWTSPVPHAPPEPAIRALPALPGPADPLDQLGPLDFEAEWWHHDPSDPRWDDPDPAALELRADDIDPDADAGPSRDDHDPLRDRLLYDDTRWTLDLDDPYGWIDVPSRIELSPRT